MSKQFFLLLAGVFLLFGSVYAMGSFNFFSSKEEPPAEMYQFLARSIALQPYMVSSERWSAAENNQSISTTLKQLAEEASGLREVHRLQLASFQPSAEILIEDLALTARAFERGDKEFARRMMKSSLQACASCHTHTDAGSAVRWNFDESQLRGSAFERAEFMLATRQFDEALATYRGLAEGGTRAESPGEAMLAVERILRLELKVKLDPEATMKSLGSILRENQRLTEAQKLQIQLWQTEVQKLVDLPKINAQEASSEELIGFAQRVFNRDDSRFEITDPESQFISAFYLSGLFYSHLQSRKSHPDSAMVLYWLSFFEKVQPSLSSFSDLSSLYLKECIERFPEHPVARRCFNDYRSNLELEFTGSSGVHMPEELQNELNRMQEKLKL